MTNIYFPVDGQGTQSLKKQNKTDKSLLHVDATAPESQNKNKQAGTNHQPQPDKYPAPLENKSTDTKTLSRKQSSRKTDRREDNRRKESQTVLLNTRSEHDRRKSAGQREQDLNDESKLFGIDTKA